MHERDVSQPKTSEPRRSRAGKIFLIFAVCSIAIAGLAVAFAPVWLPRLPGGDKVLIRYERSQRLFRAQFGLDMPGQPDLTRLPQRLAENGVTEGAPVLIRIFKREFELELWMQRDGVFHRFAIYPDLPLVRPAWPEAAARRPAGAGGLLHGRCFGAQSE